MTNRLKSKALSRTPRKPRKTIKSPGRKHPVPRLRAPSHPDSQKLARPGSEQLDAATFDNHNQNIVKIMAKYHPDLLGDLAYTSVTDAVFDGDEFSDASRSAGLEFQKQMRPKDPLERLALTQALLAHTRATWLTKLATTQSDVLALRITCEAADRSSCTFARLLRAIAEYRQPRNASPTVSIGQANLAGQQVVQNIQKQVSSQEKSDEQTRIEHGGTIDAEVVSAVKAGVEITQSCNPADATLDKKHRAKESGRKTSSRDERVQTRRAVRGHRGPAKTGERNG